MQVAVNTIPSRAETIGRAAALISCWMAYSEFLILEWLTWRDASFVVAITFDGNLIIYARDVHIRTVARFPLATSNF
jgi:hypothetical protein